MAADAPPPVPGAARSTTQRPAFDLLRPDPGGTIHSLTALGYTPEAAVADLVDNSIAAGATTVSIDFHWGGAVGSSVAVCDDGHGMNEAALLRGMTVGGRGLDTGRGSRDLGRFGMGLKTASFSQCRQLIVATRPDGAPWISRTWDIAHVLAVGDWQLLHRPPDDAAADRLSELTAAHHGPGTIVLWRHLTRLVASGSKADDTWAQREFHAQLRRIEEHLGMVFARYLTRRSGPLRLTVNGNAVQPWDPFLSSNGWVDQLPPETPVTGVTIRGFVLPHRNRLSEAEYEEAGGPGGWLDCQGFYIYRRDRLIVAGGWINFGFPRTERHKLARLSVDVGTDHDGEWSVDVRKSSATPPPSLAPYLRRLARATRERAAAVMTHRGSVVRERRSARPVDLTWRAVSRFGSTTFELNRSHPLVVDLLTRHPHVRGAVNALLALIESTLPVELIRTAPDAAANTGPSDSPLAPDRVVETAGEVLEALISQGSTGQEAMQRLLTMPPFNLFPRLAEQLDGQGT